MVDVAQESTSNMDQDDRNGGCASTFNRLPVRTASMSSAGLAECFVRESARQSSLRTCARSWIKRMV